MLAGTQLLTACPHLLPPLGVGNGTCYGQCLLLSVVLCMQHLLLMLKPGAAQLLPWDPLESWSHSSPSAGSRQGSASPHVSGEGSSQLKLHLISSNTFRSSPDPEG